MHSCEWIRKSLNKILNSILWISLVSLVTCYSFCRLKFLCRNQSAVERFAGMQLGHIYIQLYMFAHYSHTHTHISIQVFLFLVSLKSHKPICLFSKWQTFQVTQLFFLFCNFTAFNMFLNTFNLFHFILFLSVCRLNWNFCKQFFPRTNWSWFCFVRLLSFDVKLPAADKRRFIRRQ